MGGIQILFCLLFVGIPISWLWSIFDGIRFSRMSDEEFLVEYHDYCCTNGFMDKVVRLMSKFAIWVAPIAAAMVLLVFAFALDNNTPSNGGVSVDASTCGASDDARVCVSNMKQIKTAWEMAAMNGKTITSVSDCIKLGYFKKEPKCPNGGVYRIDNDGKVTCSSGRAGHVLQE